jgi:hypothetical protein
MSASTHRAGALLAAAGLLLAGCGGGAGHVVDTASGTTTPAPPPVTHANPVSLLPTRSEASSLLRPMSTPNRYDQTLNPFTLSSAFASEVPRATRLAAGTAELDVIGRRSTFLYVRVFVFKSLAAAQSLTAAFLRSTRLRTASGQPSGAPGQQGEASSQSYGARQVSYRYAFREDNVLSYVELDGSQGRVSLSDALRAATLVTQHIRAALG